jgi:cephalosporin-C deacetylase
MECQGELEHIIVTVWPSTGYAYVILDTRGQGSQRGSGGDTPDPVGSTAATPGYMTRGILDPKDYYFRRVITDAVLAVDTARALPGVDASRVAFKGGSQGGSVTLGVAGVPHAQLRGRRQLLQAFSLPPVAQRWRYP